MPASRGAVVRSAVGKQCPRVTCLSKPVGGISACTLVLVVVAKLDEASCQMGGTRYMSLMCTARLDARLQSQHSLHPFHD